MPVINHTRLEQYRIPGIAHRTVVSRELGTASFEVWDQTLAPGAATPPHRHHCEEAVVVLSGSGQVMAEGKTENFTAPCTLTVPAHLAHQISNTGDTDLRLLGVFAASPAMAYSVEGVHIPLPWEARVPAAA